MAWKIQLNVTHTRQDLKNYIVISISQCYDCRARQGHEGNAEANCVSFKHLWEYKSKKCLPAIKKHCWRKVVQPKQRAADFCYTMHSQRQRYHLKRTKLENLIWEGKKKNLFSYTKHRSVQYINRSIDYLWF